MIMRDLVRHPVTPAEIVECLQRTSRELTTDDDGGAGSMDSLLLRMAASIVEAADGMLRGIDSRLAGDPGGFLRYATPWGDATRLVEAFRCLPGG